MACRIAENRPLQELRAALGVDERCHTAARSCVRSLKSGFAEGFTHGAQGAAIGYCQALFHFAGDAGTHSVIVKDLLKGINAPWWASHELYWGYRTTEAPERYINDAIAPLAGSGRVPILITGLDTGKDLESIRAIMACSPTVVPGSTVLVRLLVSGADSVVGAVQLIGQLVNRAEQDGTMPTWWPLLQASGAFDWATLRQALGQLWRFVNVATNPFLREESFQELADQVTVAQWPIGLAEGIHPDGTIRLAPGMRISGATEESSWNVGDFTARLARLRRVPTLIVLGPAQHRWSQSDNIERLAKAIPHLRSASAALWRGLSQGGREALLDLPA